MLRVDRDMLRRKGWRRHGGHTFTYPKRPKEFTLRLHLKGKRVERIEAEDPNGVAAEVFNHHRGFMMKAAKQLVGPRPARMIEEAIEFLHNDYILTM